MVFCQLSSFELCLIVSARISRLRRYYLVRLPVALNVIGLPGGKNQTRLTGLAYVVR